ncbi:MAG TPA: cytochrome c [Xanthobacteraceae bacterium]|nr:cytochrome c [Xanthobacteraceae bacterium]
MRRRAMAILPLTLTLAACDNMANQPKLNPYELPYGARTAWPVEPPANAIARDDAGKPPAPPPVTLALLTRGKERFEINCAPCHGRTGEGDGIIVQRGFPRPPSYFIDRLRNVPSRHFYDVITHGYGVMYPYADRVEPADRWAIAAYIRALQASTDEPIAAVPADKRDALQASAPGFPSATLADKREASQ